MVRWRVRVRVHVERFVSEVRALSAATDALIPELDLPAGQYAVNVHAYALDAYEAFLRRFYADAHARIGAVAMNPGRNGAVQTGIAFTDAEWARQILPDFDDHVDRPAHVPEGTRELSGRRLLKWALPRFGDAAGVYRELLFYITCPLAVMTRAPVRNVPLPELRGENAARVKQLILSHAADLVASSDPRGILLLGRYAEEVWDSIDDPRLADVIVERTYHPAAHVSNDAYFRGMDRAYQALSDAPGGRVHRSR